MRLNEKINFNLLAHNLKKRDRIANDLNNVKERKKKSVRIVLEFLRS